MWRFLCLYCKIVSKNFGSQMQHRASFIMLLLSQAISGIAEVVVPCVLFSRFKMIHGWTLKEMAFLYGFVHMGFAVAELTSRGFDKFDDIVYRGDFDRFLLRPVGTLFQVATSEVIAIKIGRFLQGLFVFVWGALQVQMSWNEVHIVILCLCFIGTVALFYGVFVIQATLSFYLRETLELMHIVTYGGRTIGEYPITVFNVAWRLLFTCVFPTACVLYYPISVVLNKGGFPIWLGVVSPTAGIIFLVGSFQLWKIGVRYYRSTGT
jgi:ABC-2 type transport system permease protein